MSITSNSINEFNWISYLTEEMKRQQRHETLTLVPYIPLLFNFQGTPLSYANHFVFEPWFNTRIPPRIVNKTGRQIGKSLGVATRNLIRVLTKDHHNVLCITPLYEMIKRFSTNYVHDLISTSPIKGLFVDRNCVQNVLQKTFRNNSKMYFSFALRDCLRTRGLNVGEISYDEWQDFDPAFEPIINETMSGAAETGTIQYTGTPKTTDGPLETKWLQSSQAEWWITCTHCNKVNIPSIAEDLDKMIGPSKIRSDISMENPGVVCAKCGKPLHPETGRWFHKLPEKRDTFAGYHVPQIILPHNYGSADKWAEIVAKRNGSVPKYVFYNEVCGESCDTGARIITAEMLQRAAILPSNNDMSWKLEKIKNHEYVMIALGADWGGGGAGEVSYTKIAIAGLRSDGKVDVFHGYKSNSPHAHEEESAYISAAYKTFKCDFIAHDGCDAGKVRETLLYKNGIPRNKLMPVEYTHFSQGPLYRRKPFNAKTGKRAHVQLDKSRSLATLFNLIDNGYIRFFAYETNERDNNLLMDFLALVEDKTSSLAGSDTYRIIRDEKRGSDDFAHAVNYAVSAIYSEHGRWPDLSLKNLRKYQTEFELELNDLSNEELDNMLKELEQES